AHAYHLSSYDLSLRLLEGFKTVCYIAEISVVEVARLKSILNESCKFVCNVYFRRHGYIAPHKTK
ncbi:MAG: hypothetical protein ACT4OY_09305, partial [Alphaproteobacteria bacterium]